MSDKVALKAGIQNVRQELQAAPELIRRRRDSYKKNNKKPGR